MGRPDSTARPLNSRFLILTVLQGSVRVLKEFSRDLTDSQIPNVAPVILPDTYRIFMETEKYSVRTRARCIEIFSTLSSMICAMGEVDRSLSKSLLSPILPTFTHALVTALHVPDSSHATDPGLKTEVLKGKASLQNVTFLVPVPLSKVLRVHVLCRTSYLYGKNL